MDSLLKMPAMLVLALALVTGVSAQDAPDRSHARFAAESGEASSTTGLLQLPADLVVEDVSLLEAFFELESSANLSVAYSPAHFPMEQTVTCRCQETTVEEALGVILRGIPFEVSEVSGQLVVRRTEQELPPRIAAVDWVPESEFDATPELTDPLQPPPPLQGVLTGQVVDRESGQPLGGVQIHIPEEGIGTLSRDNGRYLLQNVPVGTHVLRAERIGYGTATREVSVGEDETVQVDFELQTEALGLDEVVVTGTAGEQQRRAIGNVVSSLDVEQTLERSSPASLQTMMAGEVAGAQIRAGGGNVGSGGNIWIRGISTMALNSQPIVYVDGIRVEGGQSGTNTGRGDKNISRLNDFNPEDIERVEVIKGPAAATLYGTEASNGVIQIITRKGRTGEPTINLTVGQGANFFANAEEKVPVNYHLREDGTVLTQNLVETERARGNELFRTGHIQSYALRIHGGTELLTYNVSGSFEDEVGHLFNNEQTKQTLRSNLQTTAIEDVRLSADLGYINSDLAHQPDAGRNIWRGIVRGLPELQDTEFRGFDGMPPEQLRKIQRGEELNRTTTSVTVDHTPVEWMSQRLILGADVAETRGAVFHPRLPPGETRWYGSNSDGNKEVSNHRAVHHTLDYNATASFDLTSAWTSRTTVGAQYFAKEDVWTDAEGRDMPTAAVSTVEAASIRRGSETLVENKTFGVFLQQRMGWRDQAFVTGAVRADANSAFGEEFDAAIYPKLSGTWTVSDADFWDVDHVDNLRLRSAWGMSGTQPETFAAVRTYDPATGPDDQPGVTPGNPGNPNLKPERGVELEVGVDASFLGGRINFEGTHYRQTTRDMIVDRRLAPSEGFPGAQFVNIGEVTNQGLELSIDTRPIVRDGFELGLGWTGGYNRNRLEDLGGVDVSADTRGRWHHVEGQPLGVMGSKFIATAEWGPGNELVNVTCKGPAEQDYAPMPCEEAPFHYLGNPQAQWTGSFTNTLTLMDRLTVRAFWVYQTQSWKYSTDQWVREQRLNTTETAVRRLQGDMDPVEAASYITPDIEHKFFERDDFVRLRDISASYALPTGWIEGYGLSRASLTVSGRNLYTWAHPDFRFGDPESKSFRDHTWPGWEQARLPMAQSLVTTLRVTF